jgi:hypothetical protein
LQIGCCPQGGAQRYCRLQIGTAVRCDTTHGAGSIDLKTAIKSARTAFLEEARQSKIQNPPWKKSSNRKSKILLGRSPAIENPKSKI